MSIGTLDNVLRGASGCRTIVKKEDIKNTEAFLGAYLPMVRIVKEFESATESGQLTNEDLNVSDVYQFYKSITDFALSTIRNLSNPYERLIMQKLYIEGLPFKNAVMYMGVGYSSKLSPISRTTFADRRRKALASIALSLKIIGILKEMPDEVIGFHRGDLKYNILSSEKDINK
ncbi:MAG TPA: hypothetical protein VGI33_19635 [Paenibacillus sp.]